MGRVWVGGRDFDAVCGFVAANADRCAGGDARRDAIGGAPAFHDKVALGDRDIRFQGDALRSEVPPFRDAGERNRARVFKPQMT